jgi:hypothetical protein
MGQGLRGRVAIARLWKEALDGASILARRFNLLDTPYPETLLAAWRVNEQGNALNELRSESRISLPGRTRTRPFSRHTKKPALTWLGPKRGHAWKN